MRLLLLFISFVLFFQKSVAQTNYLVKKASEKIKLDGVLDENIWQITKPLSDFWQYFPQDTVKATYPTEIYLAYDDKNIYIAARMHSKGKKYVTPSYRRDFRAGGNDNVSFVFDTFNDKTNGFLFGTNPFGVMREALLYNSATDNEFFNAFWDNKWETKTKIYDNFWVCEIAIPFTTLRFKEGSKHWNFKSYRFDTQGNENSTLVQVPQNQIIMNLGYSIPIDFEEPLKKSGANITLIPYLAAGISKDFETHNPTVNKISVGGDAKIGVTSGLNLDLTINPDFSNVEADRQVVNLTRFDINFPEQRQFFLENSDLFTGFGSYITNPFVPPAGVLGVGGAGNQIVSPFFSRQIGIAQDTNTGLSVQNRILYGARLSGKIDDNWRIGLLNTQTAKDEIKGISSINYSVAALQRKIFGRSNIAAIFVNKQVLNPEINKGVDTYNRVAGLEYNLASKDSRWQGKAFYHQVFSPLPIDHKFAHGFVMNYSVRKFIAKWSHDWVGKGFNAEVGFVPRKNFFHINPTLGFNIYPKRGFLTRYSFGIAYDQYNQPGLGVTDRQAGPFLSLSFRNSARVLMTFNQNYTYLYNDFDALRSNRKLPSLKKGTDFTYYNLSFNYVSDLRQKLSMAIQPLIGQYYDGSIMSLVGNATYRFQPYGSLAMNFSYNNIKLSSGKNQVYLIGPKFDITFSKSLFWTTYIQYNSQFDNLNVNSRVQWRFAPVSDFFLVYTDNYNSETWMPKNRAILAKVTYWLNL